MITNKIYLQVNFLRY